MAPTPVFGIGPPRGSPLPRDRDAVDLARGAVSAEQHARRKRTARGLPALRPPAPWSPWYPARTRTDPRRLRTGDLGCECEGTHATRLFATIRLRSNAGATRLPRSCLNGMSDGHTSQKTGRRILPEVVARRPPKAGWHGLAGHTLARDRRTRSIRTNRGGRADAPDPQPARPAAPELRRLSELHPEL